MSKEKQIEEAIPADAVIQALKCCASAEDNCCHCPFKMKGAGIISDSCITVMSRAALDLIYRKQSEGEWVVKWRSTFPQYEPSEYECSICGYRRTVLHNYCPNCGAKMKGGAGNPVDSILYDVIRHIEDAPTADVAPRAEWVSVEERLPENGEHCLVNCIVKRCDGTLGQYICVGYYAEKFKHLAYGVDDDCVSEHNEENDEYYIAEGWYEVIKNWDDYGFVAIDDFVTHWMPLPEPPQGEKHDPA